nr:hypothetical protein [Tanacetum cinerariifolium]
NSAFRFEERLRTLETSFSEYRQTNPFANAVSAIPSIVQQFMTQQMTEAVRGAVQIQTDRLQDSLQQENDEFLRNIDENINKIIKGQVKNQSSRTLYAIAADLSKMELKKILIEKMEGNKSIQQFDEQRNLYMALVEAYEADKAILDTYGDSTILNESAFVEEPVQTTCQMEEHLHPMFETGADDQPIVQTSQHPEWFSQPKRPPSPDRAWNTTLPATQGDA